VLGVRALRLGFVEGTTPDKWAERWRQGGRPPLALLPVDLDDVAAALDGDRIDVALTRLDPRLGGAEPDRSRCHVVHLYDEVPVVVVPGDHVFTAVDEVALADLDDETTVPVPPTPVRRAIEVVAAGGGVAVVPLSLARLHHRRDVAYRPVSDGLQHPVGMVWLRSRDADDVQALVGVAKGRTPRSSRG